MATKEFLLEDREPSPDSTTEELATVLLARFGLLPRKSDGTAKLHKLLLELNERKKASQRDHKPELAIMPVEEMALTAGIARQTAYDHLGRWLALDILKKTSFVVNSKVVIGYELNGPTFEAAFRKAEQRIKNHLETSFGVLEKLRDKVKREKLTSRKEVEEEQREKGPETQAKT